MPRVEGFAAYLEAGVGNEVGFALVLQARSLVAPGTLRAPRIVAAGVHAPEHDYWTSMTRVPPRRCRLPGLSMRVRIAPYSAEQVYRLMGFVGFQTDLEFER